MPEIKQVFARSAFGLPGPDKLRKMHRLESEGRNVNSRIPGNAETQFEVVLCRFVLSNMINQHPHIVQVGLRLLAIPPDRVLNRTRDLAVFLKDDLEIFLQDRLPVGHREYIWRLEHAANLHRKLSIFASIFASIFRAMFASKFPHYLRQNEHQNEHQKIYAKMPPK